MQTTPRQTAVNIIISMFLVIVDYWRGQPANPASDVLQFALMCAGLSAFDWAWSRIGAWLKARRA